MEHGHLEERVIEIRLELCEDEKLENVKENFQRKKNNNIGHLRFKEAFEL